MNEKTQENPHGLDWRIDVVVTVAKDNKPFNISKGDQYLKTSEFGKGKAKLGFAMPSAAALYLNIAHSTYEKAWTQKQNALTRPQKGEMRCDFLFEYFELVSTSIVFGFTALEAFSNVCIPETYYFDQKHKDIYISLGKENIERKVNLDTKLGKILPEIFKSGPIKDKKIWRDYCDLKEFRDRLIHIKSNESHSPHMKHDSVWDDLLKSKMDPPAKISFGIMEHFLKTKDFKEQPWWNKTKPHQF